MMCGSGNEVCGIAQKRLDTLNRQCWDKGNLRRLTDIVQQTTYIRLVLTEMQFSTPWSDESLEVCPKKAVRSICSQDEMKNRLTKQRGKYIDPGFLFRGPCPQQLHLCFPFRFLK